MKIETRVTKLLGIEYPIIQAPMAWITDARMIAAVSNAGGIGTLGPNAGAKTITKDVYETGERLRKQIKRVRELTDKPFAVNLIASSNKEEKKFSDRCVEVAIEEEVPVAIVSQGSPEIYTKRLKNVKMKVLHVVATPEHARKSEYVGVDAVITNGTEGGGHSGFDQLTTLCLVPQVVDAVKIPVIAGGGIADGRGLVSSFALGAEGVYMGTRFIATEECPAHPNMKQAILDAGATDTVAIRHGKHPSPFEKTEDFQTEMRRGSLRVLMTDSIRLMVYMQEEGLISPGDIDELSATPVEKGVSRAMVSSIYGDLVNGGVGAGQEVGMIKDIPSCQELISHIVSDAEKMIKNLNSYFLL